MEFLIKNNKY
jgi:hypothetical protein